MPVFPQHVPMVHYHYSVSRTLSTLAGEGWRRSVASRCLLSVARSDCGGIQILLTSTARKNKAPRQDAVAVAVAVALLLWAGGRCLEQ